MAFEIARSILPLPVRLIDRLTVDSGARLASALVVHVDVVDEGDQARAASRSGCCRAGPV
jgi:hypothetical protein